MKQYFTKTGVRLELIQGGKTSQNEKPVQKPQAAPVPQIETPWWVKLKSVLGVF